MEKGAKNFRDISDIKDVQDHKRYIGSHGSKESDGDQRSEGREKFQIGKEFEEFKESKMCRRFTGSRGFREMNYLESKSRSMQRT